MSLLTETNKISLDLTYLQAHLARILLLVRREVRRWVLAGQDPNDDYRGLYITQLEAQQLLERPLGYSWGQLVDLPEEEVQAFETALQVMLAQIAQLGEQFEQQGKKPRLLKLVETFGLSAIELDILLICIAPALDTGYERVYGYLQDNVIRRRPSVRLLLDLLGKSGIARFELSSKLQPTAPLFANRLLQLIYQSPPDDANWINQTIHTDGTLVAWLLGQYTPNSVIEKAVQLDISEDKETNQILLGELAADLLPIQPALLDYGLPLVVLYGPDRGRQKAVANKIGQQLHMPILSLDLAKIDEQAHSPIEILQLVLRDARLIGAILCLDRFDQFIETKDPAVGNQIVSMIRTYPNTLLVMGHNRWRPPYHTTPRPIYWFECRALSVTQRLNLWRYWSNKMAGETFQDNIVNDLVYSNINFENLASQSDLSSEQIQDVVSMVSLQCKIENRSMTINDLIEAARHYTNPQVGTLARKVYPRYNWTDLILPSAQIAVLHELVATARHKTQVLDKWGLGAKLVASSGITALFAGPPGTGKTMTAEVLATEMGRELYEIDLSSVISKYIGETEKNIEKIFNELAYSNAILFFDEADALFSKRGQVRDATDRYANLEISYLLQRMESYEGFTILATNLRSALDDAFTRRLHFMVEFPFPQASERKLIWQTLFPASVPQAADIDFELLANRYELAGGNIRNVIVSAAYQAANEGCSVQMHHLVNSAKRELQKMGRFLGEEFYGR